MPPSHTIITNPNKKCNPQEENWFISSYWRASHLGGLTFLDRMRKNKPRACSQFADRFRCKAKQQLHDDSITIHSIMQWRTQSSTDGFMSLTETRIPFTPSHDLVSPGLHLGLRVWRILYLGFSTPDWGWVLFTRMERVWSFIRFRVAKVWLAAQI
jgi:hypothetical protein